MAHNDARTGASSRVRIPAHSALDTLLSHRRGDDYRYILKTPQIAPQTGSTSFHPILPNCHSLLL